MIITLIALEVLFAAAAQMLLRHGATNATHRIPGLPMLLGPLQNLYTLGGLACLGFSFFLYAFILSSVELNVLFPVTTGATIILVPIGATWIFHERIGNNQILGIALILAGILLIALN